MALSRPKHGFESRWGRFFLRNTSRNGCIESPRREASRGPAHSHAATEIPSIFSRNHDADATAVKAQELGGKVVMPPFDAPWVRTTVIADPAGATLIASQFVPENRDVDDRDRERPSHKPATL